MKMRPFYSCDDADIERLLTAVRTAGIRVTPHDTFAHAYCFHRGFGLVHGNRWDGARPALYFGFGHASKPFLWAADAKLLRAIEVVLQANGSSALTIEEVAPSVPKERNEIARDEIPGNGNNVKALKGRNVSPL
jgi:hypothetical protein